MERNSLHFSSLDDVDFLEENLDSKCSILFSRTAIFLIKTSTFILKFVKDYHFKSNTFDILESEKNYLNR